MALNTTSDRYTDARRTRVYHRDDSASATEDRMGQTQAIQMQGRLFDGLSIPQIIAGAAAAATSVALASHIGIAGSVIGAAVSSVITVVSSQVYRRFLTSGAQRIKRAAHSSDSAYAPDYGYGSYSNQSTTARPARYGARVAPTKLQARASAQREATQRKVIGFSVLAALLAVVICAGSIWLFTAGQGLGERVDTLWPAAPTAQKREPDSTRQSGAQTSASASGKSEQTASSTDTSSDTGNESSDDSASSTGTSSSSSSSDGTQDSTTETNSSSGGTGTQGTASGQDKTDSSADATDANGTATQSASTA